LSFSITTDSEYNESLEDYDGDGLPDAYELANDNDPYDRNDITKDADGDGLNIQEEFLLGTSDQNPDTDFDTLPDAWEIAQGRNPLLADYQISTGTESSCALTDNGVVCWGKDNGSLNVPELYNPTAVAVGSSFACAMENSEEICWGDNQESLIGKPSLTEGICSIEESGIVCQNDNAFGSPPLIENAAQVSAGTSSACALAPDGVTCWGYNLNGENDVPALVIDPDGDGYSNQGGVDAFPLDPTRWLEEIASIEMNQTGDLDFTFTYGDSGTAIAGVKVVMTESDGTVTVLATDANGQITLPSTENTFTLSASLAEAGVDPITLVDALQIIQYAGELRTLTADQLKAADVNNDGEVDVLDALWIIQHQGELRTLDSSLIFLDTNTGKALSETIFTSGDAISISTIRTGDVDQDFDPTLITDHAPILTGETVINVDDGNTNVSTLLGTDADGDNLNYIVSGIDSSSFSINSSGVLSFNSAPNYDNKSNYSIAVTVSDGINSSVQNLIINIVNTNKKPIINNVVSVVDVEEGSLTVYQVEATDPEGDTIYYSLTGNDADLFKIDSLGLVTFIITPDYENPNDTDLDNSYDLEIKVTDQPPSALISQDLQYPILFNTQNSSSFAVAVRVTNYDEDIISLTMTGVDGTSSSPPKITISLVVDSYTNPTGIAILYENTVSSSQYWTSSSAPNEESFKMTYEYTFTAPENAPTGQWRIRTVRVNTAAGSIDHQENYLKNKGFTTRATVYNPNSDTNKPTLNSISSIEVTGNDSDLNTSIVIKFEITAKDTENGYQKGHSRWESPASEGGWALVGGWGITDLSVNPSKTTFTASLDPKTVSGEYKMEDIRLYDKAGNQHFYYCRERESVYKLLSEDDTSAEGTDYGACAVTIENPIQDNTKPVLTNFNITALLDESNGRKKIGHSIEIDNKTSWTDQETGLRRMYLRIYGPNGFMRDIHDGALGFSGETLLPLDAEAGEYYVSYFFVTDNALNDNKYYKAELDGLGFTTSVTFD